MRTTRVKSSPSYSQNSLNRDPVASHMAQLAAEFQVSKQATANAYAHYQGEILAFVFTKGGRHSSTSWVRSATSGD